VLPDRSATSHRNDRRQALPLLRGGKDKRSRLLGRREEREMAMISPEAQAIRLLRKTAHLLNSVAEAAWTNDMPSPARWELHRIGTEAYLAQRDILDMLGQPEVIAQPQADFDITAALDEVAQVVATIPDEFQTLVTQRLQGRVTSLVQRTERALPSGMRFDSDRTVVPLPDHERLPGGSVFDPLWTDPGRLGLPSGAALDALGQLGRPRTRRPAYGQPFGNQNTGHALAVSRHPATGNR